MFQKQKDTVLELLKFQKANRNYAARYWFSYQDFLDPADSFTSFACENLEGKQRYVSLIETLLHADELAKVFVEVYGFEEVKGEQFIYADTLIIYSKLPLHEIGQIFNEPEDIFPSDIGEINDSMQQCFLIDHDGVLIPAANISSGDSSVYYCWWD